MLSHNLQDGDLLLLYGGMGVGKTTFVKDLCDAMKFYHVSSPTYTITNHYDHGDKHIIHSDLYRVQYMEYDLLSEIYKPDCISIIEWSERIPQDYMVFFKNFLQVYFTEHNDIVTINAYGRFASLLASDAACASR